MGDPRAGLKVNVIEWPAEATPVVGCAAKITQPHYVQLEIGPANVLTGAEIMSVGIILKAATLQDAHAHALASKLMRQGNAGGTSANDANICLQRLVLRDPPRINKHAESSQFSRFPIAFLAGGPDAF
jgi:hypothetical protein